MGVRRDRIAYLTSLYPRATDTFVRIEVQLLRELGFDVRPFSIRRPGPELFVDESIEAEAERMVAIEETEEALSLFSEQRELSQ